MKTKYTRKELIEICEKASVVQSKWTDRDSAKTQIEVGTCLTLLKSGCKFEIKTKENANDHSGLITDNETIWIQFWVKDFKWFDWMDADEEEYPDGLNHSDYFFLYKMVEAI